jgi:hypothetical protein
MSFLSEVLAEVLGGEVISAFSAIENLNKFSYFFHRHFLA